MATHETPQTPQTSQTPQTPQTHDILAPVEELWRNSGGTLEELWGKYRCLEARGLIQQGLELGHPEAQYYLARAYHDGLGFNIDLVKAQAQELYAKASARGISHATNDLGKMYYFGHNGPPNYPKARELFELAITQGSPNAMTNLGIMYERGRGVPQDYTKARELYEMAIHRYQQLGHDSLTTPLRLSALYEKGFGVLRDSSKAIQIIIDSLARPENQEWRENHDGSFYQRENHDGSFYSDSYKSRLRALLKCYSHLDCFLDDVVELHKNAEHLRQDADDLRKENDELKREVHELHLELAYRPGSAGYHQAKNHFESLIHS